MIEQHLAVITQACNLTPQQVAVIRSEMASYAYDAIMDSSVAAQAESICGQYAGPLPTPLVHPNVDDDLLRRLDEAGSTGLDLSPGDQLAAEAAAEIRRLSGK